MRYVTVPLGWRVAACFALLMASSPGRTRAATVEFGPSADTYLRDSVARGALGFMDVRGAALDFRAYLRFDLSGIPAGAGITSATLTLAQVPGASRNDEITAGRFATYGLNNVAGNTAQNWDEATFEVSSKGTEDVTTLSGVIDLDDNVAGITESISGVAGARIITLTGAPLASFLQTRFDDGGLTTFILSNDDATDRGFGLGTKENANTQASAVLSVEYVPEPLGMGSLSFAVVALHRRRHLARPSPRCCRITE